MAQMCGVETILGLCVITNRDFSFKYLLKDANEDNLEKFLQDFADNKLTKYIKSEERPKDDKFEDQPAVYKVVQGNF
jgi:hypothetical protein